MKFQNRFTLYFIASVASLFAAFYAGMYSRILEVSNNNHVNNISENGISGERRTLKSRQRLDGQQAATTNWLLAINNSEELKHLITRIQTAKKEDFPKLYKELSNLKQEDQIKAIWILVDYWTKIDPFGAADFASSLQKSGQGYKFLKMVLSQWPEERLNDGFLWINNLADGENHDVLLVTLIRRSFKCDPVVGAKYFQEIESSRGQDQILRELVQSWAAADSDSVWNWIQGLDNENKKSIALSELINVLAGKDPGKASDLIENIPFGTRRDELISQISSKWILADRASAEKWIETLDEVDRGVALVGMAPTLAVGDPVHAATLGLSLSAGQQGKFLGVVMSVWGRSDPKGALDWVKTNNVMLPEAARRGLYNSWASHNPESAISELPNIVDKDDHNLLTKAVAVNWGMQNPQKAAEFVERLPDNELKVEALSKVAMTWAMSDSMAASKWIATLPDGESKDWAIIELASCISSSDLRNAVKWSNEINSPILREKYLTLYGKKLIDVEGNRGMDYIKSTLITPADIKLIEK
jgi:hypothetical protein